MSEAKQAGEPNVDVDWGVEGNARLTGSVAAVLLVLLAVEGITILEVGRLLRLHVFVGMLLLPPVLLKSASTGYRFARYYTGDEPYARRGPPHWILRLLGPIVGALTFTVLITGIVLLWAPGRGSGTVLFLHKASFVIWFGAMTVHVLGHLGDTFRLAPRDWVPARRSIPGTGLRRTALLTSLVVGVSLGALALGQVDAWLHHGA